MMACQVNHVCNQPGSACSCPEILIRYVSRFDEYGIVRGGEDDPLMIYYCPWCGAKLPDSKRELWFDTLKDLGFSDPFRQAIPEDFQTNKWFSRRR